MNVVGRLGPRALRSPTLLARTVDVTVGGSPTQGLLFLQAADDPNTRESPRTVRSCLETRRTKASAASPSPVDSGALRASERRR